MITRDQPLTNQCTMNASLYNLEGGPFHIAAEADGTLPGQKRPHQMLPATRGTAKKRKLGSYHIRSSCKYIWTFGDYVPI